MPRAAAGKVDQLVIDRALGEARFVRAYCFYMLAEYWGDVPIVGNSTELVASNNLFLPKSTRSSVLEFARRDLEFATAEPAHIRCAGPFDTVGCQGNACQGTPHPGAKPQRRQLCRQFQQSQTVCRRCDYQQRFVADAELRRLV